MHGTGHVKPNGALKRTDFSRDSAKPSPSPVAPTAATAVVAAVATPHPQRMRTVIDQTPVPLFCSDKCCLADLQSTHGALDIKYNPNHCASPILPPVPPNSFSAASGPEDTDSSSGASIKSCALALLPIDAIAFSSAATSDAPMTPATSSVAPTPPPTGDKYASSAYAVLQAIYTDLPPCPPPPPLLPEPVAPKKTCPRNDYQSGVMITAQRIKAALCSNPPKPSALCPNPVCPVPLPIPGWTDGSHAWCASVYSLASPNEVPLPGEEGQLPRAYRGFVASPDRARYVTAMLSADAADLPTRVRLAAAAPLKQTPRAQSETAALYSKFHATLLRKHESRASPQYAAAASPASSTRSVLPTRREIPLVKPGAEGMLLVPDVKMRRASSMVSVDAVRSPLSYASLGGPGANSRQKRSPLSRQGSATSFTKMATSGSESSRSVGNGSTVDSLGEEDETVRVHPNHSAPTRTRLSQSTWALLT